MTYDRPNQKPFHLSLAQINLVSLDISRFTIISLQFR